MKRMSLLENLGVGTYMLLCTILTTHAAVQYVRDTFTDPTNHGNFNHLKVDRNTGRIYIGAVNRLYQLSETLRQEEQVCVLLYINQD